MDRQRPDRPAGNRHRDREHATHAEPGHHRGQLGKPPVGGQVDDRHGRRFGIGGQPGSLPKLTLAVLQQLGGAVGDHHPTQRAVFVLQRQARPVHLEHCAGGVDDTLQGREHVPGSRSGPAQLIQAAGEGSLVDQRVVPLRHRWITVQVRVRVTPSTSWMREATSSPS
jgi:hypothetical protein